MSLLMVALSYCLSAAAPAAPVCQVSSSGIAFGSADTLHARKRSSVGLLKLRCMGPGEASITIGLLADGSSVQRRRFHPGAQAPAFALYLDPAHQQPWGDGVAGSFVIQRRVRDGFSEQIPVYAGLEMDGSNMPGNYSSALAMQVQVDELPGD